MTGFGDLAAAFSAALSFLSRLPVPRFFDQRPPSPDANFLRFAPLAGVAIAVLPSIALALGALVNLPSLATAGLSIAILVGVTGALHEDGLADVADGFGGGKTRDQKLAIMRDSRIGTFGAAALGCSLLLRTACLASLLDRNGPGSAIAALLSAAAVSRMVMLIPMTVLAPARRDGLAHGLGTLRPQAAIAAGGLATALLTCAAMRLPVVNLVVAAAGAAAASLVMTSLARRQIGGVTGDVIGAAQQAAEITVLLILSAGPG